MTLIRESLLTRVCYGLRMEASKSENSMRGKNKPRFLECQNDPTTVDVAGTSLHPRFNLEPLG